MNTNFSVHADARIAERLSLLPDEVAEYIDWDVAIKIGDEPGTPRDHLCFYSAVDRWYFVAIRDRVTRTVITVLPLEYYQQLHCVVPDPLLAEAKAKARPRVPVQEDVEESPEAVKVSPAPGQQMPESVAAPPVSPAPEQQGPTRYEVSGAYLSAGISYAKILHLGSWPIESGITPELVTTMVAAFERKRKNPNDTLLRLWLKPGKRGQSFTVELHGC